MITEIDVRESVTWTVGGLLLEVRCAGDDRFEVIVRHVGSAPVLWDGEFMARGRTLDDLPADDFSLEVLARMALDQADRLGRFVYAQDDVRALLRDFHAALPETFRP
jgi:hypothetical protein